VHTFRQQLVVLLCALHMLAVTLVACPAPVRGATRADYNKSQVQRELKLWTERFEVVGIHMSTNELADRLVDGAKQWMELRSLAIGPFIAYLRALGSTQGWYMFTGPDTEPSDFVVEGRGAEAQAKPPRPDDGWRLLAGSSTEGSWTTHPLYDHRARRHIFMTGWGESRKTLRELCGGLADMAFADLPDVEEIRCRFLKRRIVTPSEHRAGVVPESKEVRRVQVTRTQRAESRAQAKVQATTPPQAADEASPPPPATEVTP
jgi:hypothetical protein